MEKTEEFEALGFLEEVICCVSLKVMAAYGEDYCYGLKRKFRCF